MEQLVLIRPGGAHDVVFMGISGYIRYTEGLPSGQGGPAGVLIQLARRSTSPVTQQLWT